MSTRREIARRLVRRAAMAAKRPMRLSREISTFENWREYRGAAKRHDDGETLLRTRDGLTVAIRHNRWDAIIVGEQFVARDYLRHFKKPQASGKAPVVVDIGGYIGDFTLFCAHRLGADVVVYEPTAENYAILERNLDLNPHLRPRVTAVPKGVSSGPEVLANVLVTGNEVHVSSQWYSEDPTAEQRTFACDSLEEVLDSHQLHHVDLLKVDCEGGEYEIFKNVPADTYARIGGIVLEWHRVPGWESLLEQLRGDLTAAGFLLQQRGQLLYATR